VSNGANAICKVPVPVPPTASGALIAKKKSVAKTKTEKYTVPHKAGHSTGTVTGNTGTGMDIKNNR
jgi:hypothetical protein